MAVRLETLESLGRKVRQDPLNKLMIPTWTLAEQAIRAGKIDDGLELVNYARTELKDTYYLQTYLIALLITFIADTSGEEAVDKAWRYTADYMRGAAPGIRNQPLETQLQLAAELQRGHCCGPTEMGEATFVEEKDRYLLILSPCGSGGKIRKMGKAFGRTKKAYPWSWGQAGVPYYCTHCCIYHELMQIEARGYPMRVHDNADWTKDPCIQIFYKEPELIPAKYFTRLGKVRDVSKFKKP